MRKGKGMKKRIISKILTLLVVFSMVFTLLPVNNKIVHAGDSKVNIGDYIYLGTYQGKKIKWRCIGEDSLFHTFSFPHTFCGLHVTD